MAFFGNVRLEAEPFEESQGAESPKSVASPDELKAFYLVMEKQEIVQRKLSRRKSASTRSIFSRKAAVAAPLDPPPPTITDTKTSESAKELEKERVEELKDQVPSMQSRSIIPDQLQELPAWYTKEDWAGVPIPSQKMRYPMHNPVGPRRYINHHLLPSFRSIQLPPIFSSSFPPMAPTVHEASPDSTRVPGPSRTPSGSPLPTPTSSETRIADNVGKRSRKTSQTAHDTVDLLDVSDPWGTNWHHQSPYDVGLNASPVSPDVPENSNQTRPRVSSMTTGQRRRTMPSPLSQSTSAIHLHEPDSSLSHIPRKLSKHRRPILGNLFGGHGNTIEGGKPKAASSPATPVEQSPAPHPPSSTKEPSIVENGSKRNSTLRQSITVSPSVLSQTAPADKKVKRGSVLGRLARRFSVMKKPIQEPFQGLTGRDSGDWHHIGVKDVNSDRESRRSVQMVRQSSPEKQQTDSRRSIEPVKRVPPPSLESGAADRSSSISVEAPFSIGRLTIANPDAPSDGAGTPIQYNASLYPDQLNSAQQHRTEDTSVNSTLQTNTLLTSPAPPPNQLSIHASSALSHDIDNHVETSKPGDYRISKLLPDPSPSPLILVNSIEPPMHAEEHLNSKPVPVLSMPRSTRVSVDATDGLQQVMNNRESNKVQRPSDPSPTLQTQSSSSTVNNSQLATSVSRFRTWKPASSLIQTQLNAEPTEILRTSESGVPRSVPSLPVASPLPFPSRVELLPSIPSFDPIRLSAASSMIVDSPLSAASMFVHPPTPHDSPGSIYSYALPGPPPPQKAPLQDDRLAPQDIPSTKVKNESSSTGRQTETFKLVRSASGNLHPMGSAIIAAGQQWEVVESDVPHRGKVRERSVRSKDREFVSKEKGSREKESKERELREREREAKHKESRERESREKETREKERQLKEKESRGRESKERVSKDRENGGRREQRKQDRSKADTEAEAERRRTISRQRNGRVHEHSASASSSSGRPRTRSMDNRRRSEIPDSTPSGQAEHKYSRRRDEDRERRPERRSEVAKPLIKPDVSKPQPAPPPPTPGPPPPPKLERRSSTSNRPTSELPSAAELNSLRARDVWEMERLWKGRSMYGVEPNGLADPDIIPLHSGVEAKGESPTDGPSHGSSHTSFMVQTPFQVPPSSSISNSMPSGPPPIVYAASPLPQSLYPSVVQVYTDNHRSFPASISFPSQDPLSGKSSSPLANPLPEPPRESPYTPSTTSDSRGGHATDYWTKYAGATKAH